MNAVNILASAIFGLIIVPLSLVWFFRLLGKGARGVPTSGNIARAQARETARVTGEPPPPTRSEQRKAQVRAGNNALHERIAAQLAAQEAAKAANPGISKRELREVAKAVWREQMAAQENSG